MSTFTLIAIPNLIFAGVMLILAATKKQTTFFIVGEVFMISALVNGVIGVSLH